MACPCGHPREPNVKIYVLMITAIKHWVISPIKDMPFESILTKNDLRFFNTLVWVLFDVLSPGIAHIRWASGAGALKGQYGFNYGFGLPCSGTRRTLAHGGHGRWSAQEVFWTIDDSQIPVKLKNETSRFTYD